MFTEYLLFWTSKKMAPIVIAPEVDVTSPNLVSVIPKPAALIPEPASETPLDLDIITTMPAAVTITIPEEPSKSNEEEIAEVTVAPEGAQSDFETTEKEVSNSKPVVVPISIPNESTKNNPEEIDEIINSVEATDALEVAQGATTTNAVALKAEATKVVKAKPAGKKVAYQTSPGSSIAKNKPKRACTLKRNICGQPLVEAPRKVSMKSLVAQKRMSDFFPQK